VLFYRSYFESQVSGQVLAAKVIGMLVVVSAVDLLC